jgi:hypothetical protein
VRRALAIGFATLIGTWPWGVAAGPDPVVEHYVLNCSGCHRLDGSGIPGVTPSLHDLAPLAASEAGRAYLARVPGVAQAPLGDAELTALLDWVVAHFSGLPVEHRFDVATVARLRADPLRDPVAARQAIAAPADDRSAP